MGSENCGWKIKENDELFHEDNKLTWYENLFGAYFTVDFYNSSSRIFWDDIKSLCVYP